MFPLMGGSLQTTITADINQTDTRLDVLDIAAFPDVGSTNNLVTMWSSKTIWEVCKYTAKVPTTGGAGYLTIVRSGDDHSSSSAGTALSWTTGAKCARNVNKRDFDIIQANIADNSTVTQAHISSTSNPHLEPRYNYIVNGGFTVNQRALASVNVNSGFPVDRWVLLLTGSAGVASQQAHTLGQTLVAGEPKNYLRAVVTHAVGVGNYSIIHQRIEGVRTLAGQQVVISFYAKADAPKPIAIELSQYFGTGGSPSTAVTGIGVNKPTLTTQWVRYQYPITIPSISGKTLGTAGNDFLAIHFWFEAGSDYNTRTGTLGQQSGTFEISNVKLESGSVATPFVNIGYAAELQRCQRYFRLIGGDSSPIGAGYFYTAGQARIVYTLPVTMRATPTVSYSSVSDLSCTIPMDTRVVTSYTATLGSSNSIIIVVETIPLSQGSWFPTYLIINKSTGWLAVSAEL